MLWTHCKLAHWAKSQTRKRGIFMAAKKKTKKAPAKKAVPARKITAVKKPMSKSAIINELTQNTQLNKKQVSSVLESLPS